VRRLALPALLLSLACNPGFDPQYRVIDLRILAVHAEVSGSADANGVTTADPNLDETLQLEALVANPQGRPDLRVRWFVCAPSLTGGLPPCLDPTLITDPSTLGAAEAFELPGPPLPDTGERLPPIALSALPQPVRDGLQQAIQVVRAQATTQPTYQCRLYVEIPLVVFAQAGGRQGVAVKRVRLVQTPAQEQQTPPHDYYAVNHNPVVKDAVSAADDSCTGGSSVTLPAALPAGTTRTLCAQAASDPETYDFCDSDGVPSGTREIFQWQWYVTAGEFPDVGGLGNAEGSHLDFDRPRGAFTLWLILRDGRGGDVWKRFDVAAAP
jgi:hypothetical protein